MQTVQVDIQELKSSLREFLRQVKSGAIVIVTERGKPIGQIIPISSSLDQRMESLAQAGFLAQVGRKLPPLDPSVTNKGERLISDLVSENRGIE